MANAATPIDVLRPRDFSPEGLHQFVQLPLANDIAGLPLKKVALGFNAISRVPVDATLGTGFTFLILLTDDGHNAADLGKVVRVGVQVKRLINDETTDIDTSGSAEATVDITLSATAGGVAVGSLAVANSGLDSIAAGELFALRVRRVSTATQDTCADQVLLLAVVVNNTAT